MASEWIELLLRVNLALAAGVAVVMAVRPLARRYFGARIAYTLWLLPLAAAAMCFTPARVEHVVLAPASVPLSRAAPAAAMETVAAQPPYLLWAWIAGALLSLIVLALRQARFTLALGRLHKRDDLGQHVRGAETCEHGPAVIGVLRPIIVTPADFDSRFDAEERRIVLAHERAHMAQGDPWTNVLVALLQCVNWFNPFVHIGARALRVDQELACDAAVLAQTDGIRRRYAEAMLKTHIAASAPIGCAWPPSDLNALKERIAMLKRNLPSRTQTLLGGAAIVAVTAGVAAAAWAAQPTRIVTTIGTATPVAATSTDPVAVFESLLSLESTQALQPLTSDPALNSLDVLEAVAGVELDDADAIRTETRIIRDGVVIRYEDMSPAERAEVRRSLEQARVARDQANAARDRAIAAGDQARAAGNQARASADQARAASEQARVRTQEAREQSRIRIVEARDREREARAIASTRGDNADRIREAREVAQEAREAERQARQEQLEAEREARTEAAEARAEAMVDVREAMLEMENELARLSPQERAEARNALREAHSEIALELQQARARGDTDEIEALEIAERSLRNSMRTGN